jgi:gas vesicle protein
MTNNYSSDLPPQDSSAGLGSGSGLSSTDLDDDFAVETVGATGSDTGTGSGSGVKEEASHLAGQAADAGQHVAQVAKDETKKVAAETGTQVKNLVREAGNELKEQASVQQARVADGLRSVGNELSSMAEKSENPGMATDLVQQVSARASSVADWLEAREPGSILEEVKGFARQRPGVFIALAAGAGILAGRLTRALTEPSDSDSDLGSGSTYAPPTGAPVYGSDTPIDSAPATDLPVYGSLGGDVIAGEGAVPGVSPTGGL